MKILKKGTEEDKYKQKCYNCHTICLLAIEDIKSKKSRHDQFGTKVYFDCPICHEDIEVSDFLRYAWLGYDNKKIR